MKSSVYQYPYEKVFRRTKGVLTKLGLKITNFNSVTGNITATSNFSFFRPTVKINLVIEAMENNNTKVSVTGLQIKRNFFTKDKDAEVREAQILDAISTVI